MLAVYNSIQASVHLPILKPLSSLSLVYPDSGKAASDTLKVILTDTLSIPYASDSLEANIDYKASDSIVYDLKNKLILLYNDGSIHYDDLQLNAADISIAWETNILTATQRSDSLGNISGRPDFKQGSQTFSAHKLAYNFKSGKGKIYGLFTQEGDGFLRGNEVKKDSLNNLYARKAYFTTCNLENPHFYIEANPVKVIPDKLLVTGPANLVIEGVRTPLVLPFAIFPMQKGQRSGIILPEFGTTDNLGYSLTNGGYYFGLSDYVDLTLKGDIYTSGSWRLNASSKFKKRYKYAGNLSLGLGHLIFGSELENNLNTQKDFSIRGSFALDPKLTRSATFSATINIASSGYDKYNSLDYANHINNTISSSIAYSKRWPGKPFNFNMSLSHSQNTSSRMLDLTLPHLSFGVSRIYPFKRKISVGKQRWYEKIGFNYTMDSRNLLSIPDSLLFRASTLNKFQFGVHHSLPVSGNFKVLKYFTLNTSFNYTENWFIKTIDKSYQPLMLDDSSFRYVQTDTLNHFKAARFFSSSVSLNTRLYGRLNFRKGWIKTIRHVVTPNISFNYRPDFSSNSWGYYQKVQNNPDGSESLYSIFPNGMYSAPPTGKYGGIGLSISNILEMKVRDISDTVSADRKIKLLENFTFSTFYNLAVDSLNLNPLRLSGRTTLFGKLGINFSASWDPYVMNQSGIRINQFEWTKNKRLARLTQANISLNTSLNSKTLAKKNAAKISNPTSSNAKAFPATGYYYDIPWNVNINYSFNLSRGLGGVSDSTQISQSVNINGNLSLTQNWSIGLGSGYDFVNRKLVYTTVDIQRDLHCWEMSFRWIPIGILKSYNFSIRVKSSTLKDLKIEKKSSPYDNL